MSGRQPWWPEHDEILRRAYALNPAHKIAALLGRSVSTVYQRAYKLGLSKPESWASDCTRKRWQEGRHEKSRAHQFRAGQSSWSKGTKGRVGVQEGCRRTQFKKGCMAGAAQHNYVPIGTEKIRDGYLCRKLTDDPDMYPANRWQPLHRIVWMEANGPVPAGHAVAFKEGRYTTDKALITLDAVELVSRAELMRRNTLWNRYPPEVAQVMQLRGALNRKIRNRSKSA